MVDTGAQYSSPSDSSDSTSSDSDSEIEGTENITVAKRYAHQCSISHEDLYTAPTPPNKWFRTSTPDPTDRRPEKEPIRCPLKEIINHRPALHIPKVDIIVAPGQTSCKCTKGKKREYKPWQVEVVAEMPIRLFRGLTQPSFRFYK